jgi:response regulator of citrate/malate metabolism
VTPSIMLVSQDRELARVIRDALRDTPVKVALEATSSKEASDGLAMLDLGLVVLDMFFQGSSGLEMAKNLKRVKEDCNFMLLTRMRTRAVIERAFRYGVQDVLHYPVGTDILRDTILHRLEAVPLIEADDDSETAHAGKK